VLDKKLRLETIEELRVSDYFSAFSNRIKNLFLGQKPDWFLIMSVVAVGVHSQIYLSPELAT
jgi:hypothetical protein